MFASHSNNNSIIAEKIIFLLLRTNPKFEFEFETDI